MANEDGHIHAPVGIKEVADVLGENTLDVATLCMSSKINPYSLIRPVPATVPNREVKEMKTLNTGTLMSGVSGVYTYMRKQWNYQVPRIGNPQDIENIRDIEWYRPTPTNTDYKSLNHFDGYLHNAVPAFNWSIGEPKAGDQIVVMLGFGLTQPDVVSTTGDNNKGGVVSVLEVFGDAPFYYGVTIKQGNRIRYFYGRQSVNPGSTTGGVIETGITAEPGVVYDITPWISDLPPTASGGVPSNANFFSLKFAPDFISHKSFTVREITLSAGLIVQSYNASTRYANLYLTVTNQFDYFFDMYNVTLHIQEYGRGTFPPRTIVLNAGPIRVNSGASGFSLQQYLPFTLDAAYMTIWVTATATSVYGSQTVTTNFNFIENPSYT